MRSDENTKAIEDIDAETVDSLRSEGTFFDEIVGLFGREVSHKLATIALAVEMRNFEEVARAAHSLTGTAISVGARAMRDRCLRLEDMARLRSFETAEEELGQLRTACDRVRRALERALVSR